MSLSLTHALAFVAGFALAVAPIWLSLARLYGCEEYDTPWRCWWSAWRDVGDAETWRRAGRGLAAAARSWIGKS